VKDEQRKEQGSFSSQSAHVICMRFTAAEALSEGSEGDPGRRVIKCLGQTE